MLSDQTVRDLEGAMEFGSAEIVVDAMTYRHLIAAARVANAAVRARRENWDNQRRGLTTILNGQDALDRACYEFDRALRHYTAPQLVEVPR